MATKKGPVLFTAVETLEMISPSTCSLYGKILLKTLGLTRYSPGSSKTLGCHIYVP